MVLPMPTITASTSTFTPDDTTLPSTRSARNAVRFHSAKGTSTKPASVVSLNSISVTNSCTASTKKLTSTTSQARNNTTMLSRFEKHAGKAGEVADLGQDRMAGVDADAGESPGLQKLRRRQRGSGGDEPETGEGAKEDAGERIEVGDDEGEGADVEHLLDQLGDQVFAAAHRPEEPSQHHVDDHQRRGEKGDLGSEQTEARIDVLRKNIQEMVDDAEIVHDPAIQGVGSVADGRRDRRDGGGDGGDAGARSLSEEAPPPCFAGGPAELVVTAREIGAALAQYDLQSLGIAGQRLRRVARCLIAASRHEQARRRASQ